MPNWCENRLTITGPAADVDALAERIVVATPDRQGYDHPHSLDYGTVVPEPEAEARDAADPDGGYEWRLKHWGVKWNHPGLYTEECLPAGDGESELVLEFDSPWSSPVPFAEALADAYPTLAFRLRFEEAAMDVLGVWRRAPGGRSVVEDAE